eukprot:TRINITY_DN111362_c0_g1_i1.p1 TRINITY_DN111362_c0_g1~~TRINITY_DN111362_c0_g1_i1.p1  ORF type:complete len:1147 (-),score=236.50 TRINITY_DN111362_c0_g1_i1:25-3465(-)
MHPEPARKQPPPPPLPPTGRARLGARKPSVADKRQHSELDLRPTTAKKKTDRKLEKTAVSPPTGREASWPPRLSVAEAERADFGNGVATIRSLGSLNLWWAAQARLWALLAHRRRYLYDNSPDAAFSAAAFAMEQGSQWTRSFDLLASLQALGREPQAVFSAHAARSCHEATLWRRSLRLIHPWRSRFGQGLGQLLDPWDVETRKLSEQAERGYGQAFTAAVRTRDWQQAIMYHEDLHSFPLPLRYRAPKEVYMSLLEEVEARGGIPWPGILELVTNFRAELGSSSSGGAAFFKRLQYIPHLRDHLHLEETSKDTRIALTRPSRSASSEDTRQRLPETLGLLGKFSGPSGRPKPLVARLLWACRQRRDLSATFDVLGDMRQDRMAFNVDLLCTVIQASAEASSWTAAMQSLSEALLFEEGSKLLDTRPVRDSMRACNLSDAWAAAFGILAFAIQFSVQHSKALQGAALNACSRARRWEKAVLQTCRLQDMGIHHHGGSLTSTVAALRADNRGPGESTWRLVLNFLRYMRGSMLPPNDITMNAVLSGTAGGSWNSALGLLRSFAGHWLRSDSVSFNTVMHGCGAASLWRQSVEVVTALLDNAITPCYFSANTAIVSCGNAAKWRQAARALDCMVEQKVLPRADELSALVLACGHAESITPALAVLTSARSAYGVRMERRLCSSSLKACKMVAAWMQTAHFLEKLGGCSVELDASSFNAALSTFGQAGPWQQAVQHLASSSAAASRPDTFTLNALADSFAVARCWEEASSTLSWAAERGVRADDITTDTFMNALDSGRQWTASLRLLGDIQGLRLRRTVHTLGSLSSSLFGAEMDSEESWSLSTTILGKALLENLEINLVAYTNVAGTCQHPPDDRSAEPEDSSWMYALETLLAARSAHLRADAMVASTIINAHAAALRTQPRTAAWAWRAALEAFVVAVVAGHKLDAVPANAVAAAPLRPGGNVDEKAMAIGEAWTFSIAFLRAARAGRLAGDRISYGTLINAWATGAGWQSCLDTLEEMRSDGYAAHLTACNAVMHGCALGNSWTAALRVLAELREVAPAGRFERNLEGADDISFGAAVTALRYGRRWDIAVELLELMSCYGPEPSLSLFGDVAKACEEAGERRLAAELLLRMQRGGAALFDGLTY